MNRLLTGAIAALAIVALPVGVATVREASAQTSHGHKHDHDKMAKHGGTIAEVGSYDVEIVVASGAITVYVYDHDGNDISKQATKGDAIFVVSGASKKVALAPKDGPLVGQLGFDTKGMEDLDTVLRLTVGGKTHTGKADVHLE